MRGEDEISGREAEMLGNFRRVPMREKVISAEILVYFHKVRIALRLFTCARDARFAVAYDAACAMRPVRLKQRLQPWNHGGRITPRVRHDARLRQVARISSGR